MELVQHLMRHVCTATEAGQDLRHLSATRDASDWHSRLEVYMKTLQSGQQLDQDWYKKMHDEKAQAKDAVSKHKQMVEQSFTEWLEQLGMPNEFTQPEPLRLSSTRDILAEMPGIELLPNRVSKTLSKLAEDLSLLQTTELQIGAQSRATARDLGKYTRVVIKRPTMLDQEREIARLRAEVETLRHSKPTQPAVHTTDQRAFPMLPWGVEVGTLHHHLLSCLGG